MSLPSDLQFAFFDRTIIPITLEAMRLFPDGLVIASGIFALITLSYPYGVFFGTMLEAGVIFNLLQYFMKWVHVAGMPVHTASTEGPMCRTGFSNEAGTFTGVSMFPYNPLSYSFPSPPIFMLTTAASYIFTTLNTQTKELEALGPAYSSRYYVSAILLIILIGIFATFRLLYGCDTFGSVIITIPIGLILGALLVQQNVKLFGPTSVNLLGIPLLRNRAANGKKIYVCPK